MAGAGPGPRQVVYAGLVENDNEPDAEVFINRLERIIHPIAYYRINAVPVLPRLEMAEIFDLNAPPGDNQQVPQLVPLLPGQPGYVPPPPDPNAVPAAVGDGALVGAAGNQGAPPGANLAGAANMAGAPPGPNLDGAADMPALDNIQRIVNAIRQPLVQMRSTFSGQPGEDARSHFYNFRDWLAELQRGRANNDAIRGAATQITLFKNSLGGKARGDRGAAVCNHRRFTDGISRTLQ